MIKFEQFMEIQLLRQQSFSLRAIASQLHISRNTVRKYLQQRSLPTYLSQKARPLLLTAHHGYIQERLQSALPHQLPATVILREIQQQGYQGSLSLLRGYIRSIRPPAQPEPVVRFETKPGVQMQVDWSQRRGCRSPIYAFLATLGFSRLLFVTFTIASTLHYGNSLKAVALSRSYADLIGPKLKVKWSVWCATCATIFIGRS